MGAGPGDPGLITLKGQSCLQKADVVIYDYLSNSALLKLARKDALLIAADLRGKRFSDGSLMDQGLINRLIVKHAFEGKMVVRLKGGDPFLFGRGGEEAEVLVKNKIPFEVVPGVTSALAAPAYAGIPLTHRDFAASVAIVTGHRRVGKEILITEGETLVYLMGIENLAQIVKGLLLKGKSGDTPIALIRWGTRPNQQTLVSTLKDVVALAKKQKFKAPAIIIVGKVVTLRKSLNWFESKPLFGQRIVVTRTQQQASPVPYGTGASILSEKLESLGAEVIEFPTIEIKPIQEYNRIDRAIENLKSYFAVIFTSQFGVKYFFERLAEKGKDVRSLAGIKVYSIGPGTTAVLKSYGIRADFQPAEFRAEGLIAAFKEPLIGKKILIPRALVAREILPQELTKKGAAVEVIPVYRAEKPGQSASALISKLKAGEIDMVTFTSSQTVTNFVDAIGAKNKKYLQKVKIACIGPITAQTAKENGLKVHFQAKEYTIEGLVQAIVSKTH